MPYMHTIRDCNVNLAANPFQSLTVQFAFTWTGISIPNKYLNFNFIPILSLLSYGDEVCFSALKQLLLHALGEYYSSACLVNITPIETRTYDFSFGKVTPRRWITRSLAYSHLIPFSHNYSSFNFPFNSLFATYCYARMSRN